MNSSLILFKIRPFLSKFGPLILLFQKSPIVQMLFPQANIMGGASLANSVSLAITTVVGLGAYDSVAGATAIAQVTPLSGSTTVPLAVGATSSISLQLTGLTETGSPAIWTLAPQPAGLNAPTIPAAFYASITGTPTTPGTTTVTVNAWHKASATGDKYSKAFTFCILGFSTHPASAAVASGATELLTSVATGVPAGVTPTYQWFEGSTPGSGTLITGATLASYTTPPLTAPKSYHVKVTSVLGTRTVFSYSSVATLTVSAPAPTKLVHTTPPSTGIAGTPFSVTVQAQDSTGNAANVSSATTITLGKGASGAGTLSGTLTGIIPIGFSSVTFTTPVYSKSDTLTLTASATIGMTGLTAVTSGNIVFSSGALDHFDLNGLPSAATAGTSITGITVTAHDANSNTVNSFTGTVDYSGTAGVTGTSAAFTAGVLSAVSLTPTMAGSDLSIIATGNTQTGTATITTVSPGVAVKMVFSNQPSASTQSGVVFAQQPAVTVQDAYGNKVADSIASISLAIKVGTPPTGSVGTLSGTTTVVATTGIATFSGLSINAAGIGYKLTATSAGLTEADSSAFDITAATSPYTNWTSGLPADQQVPMQTPQNDGVSNLLKYAFNMNPLAQDRSTLAIGAGQTTGLPGIIRMNNRLHIEYIRRRASTNPGISYTPQCGSDLSGWNLLLSPETVTPIGTTDWERVEVDGPLGETRCFARVQVIQAP